MSKLKIIVKLCQSGKTFTKLSQIKELIATNEGHKNVHIIFTDNSILQTIQLKERITPFMVGDTVINTKVDLEDDVDDADFRR